MAINTEAVFIGKVQSFFGRVAAANTNKDGTGALVTLITGATDGTAINEIWVKSEVTTAAACVTLFVDKSGTIYFWKEFQIPAQTSSSTAVSFQDAMRSGDGLPLLILKSGEILKFACTVNQACIVGGQAGDFTV